VTVEENVVIPNVPEAQLAALQADPLFQRFPLHGGKSAWSGLAAINTSVLFFVGWPEWHFCMPHVVASARHESCCLS
jgi:hypothetical protein